MVWKPTSLAFWHVCVSTHQNLVSFKIHINTYKSKNARDIFSRNRQSMSLSLKIWNLKSNSLSNSFLLEFTIDARFFLSFDFIVFAVLVLWQFIEGKLHVLLRKNQRSQRKRKLTLKNCGSTQQLLVHPQKDQPQLRYSVAQKVWPIYIFISKHFENRSVNYIYIRNFKPVKKIGQTIYLKIFISVNKKPNTICIIWKLRLLSFQPSPNFGQRSFISINMNVCENNRSKYVYPKFQIGQKSRSNYICGRYKKIGQIQNRSYILVFQVKSAEEQESPQRKALSKIKLSPSRRLVSPTGSELKKVTPEKSNAVVSAALGTVFEPVQKMSKRRTKS